VADAAAPGARRRAIIGGRPTRAGVGAASTTHARIGPDRPITTTEDSRMSNHTLVGRRIAVTGGLGALGRQTGTWLIACGAQVVLVDRAAPTPVDGVAAVLGGVDLADADAARMAMDAAAAQLAGLDGLVNVAGGFAWEVVDGGRADTWDRMYTINLRTALLASQAALPHLRRARGAAIVNVGAAAAAKAGKGMGAYSAAKSGVARLTEAMAEEFKDDGPRVNAVLPSILDTPANRADMPQADPTRWVTPAQLARAIAFLLSDDAAAVTGACLPVTGRV
jgi:NAD(P)-dependent dehydrogenase (short-subunit alcohol dehydrogenase family)